MQRLQDKRTVLRKYYISYLSQKVNRLKSFLLTFTEILVYTKTTIGLEYHMYMGGVDMFSFFGIKRKNQMVYSALDVANYIVNKCVADKKPISNLQLQKILYFLQKEFLQKKHRPLFTDEIEAWPFGPVVRSVYYKFCGFGASPLFELSKKDINFDPDDKSLINNIVESNRRKNPWDLVEDTHKNGGAWDRTYQHGAGNRKIISKELIEVNG